MQPNKNNNNQSGNAFILILVGIFLFAALIFTFTRSGQKGTGNLNKSQSKIIAQEILNYAQTIEGAVNKVRQNGCSENEINFSNSLINGYSNTSAPPNNKCNIFDMNGGKATIQNAQTNWTNSGNNWSFNSVFQVTDVGTTCVNSSCADLSINLQDIQTIICEEINRSLFNDSTIPVDSDFNFTAYTGTFSNPTDIADEVSSAMLRGRGTGCFRSTADNQNIFYHILLAR